MRRSLLAGLLLGTVLHAWCGTVHDWENQAVLQINREPARAAFFAFQYQLGDRQQSLDGAWKFNWTRTPDEQPQGFFQTDFNDDSWPTLAVPADWEMNGYGTPIYPARGARLTYLGQTGNWYKVRYNGNVLYISKDYSYLR